MRCVCAVCGCASSVVCRSAELCLVLRCRPKQPSKRWAVQSMRARTSTTCLRPSHLASTHLSSERHARRVSCTLVKLCAGAGAGLAQRACRGGGGTRRPAVVRACAWGLRLPKTAESSLCLRPPVAAEREHTHQTVKALRSAEGLQTGGGGSRRGTFLSLTSARAELAVLGGDAIIFAVHCIVGMVCDGTMFPVSRVPCVSQWHTA